MEKRDDKITYVQEMNLMISVKGPIMKSLHFQNPRYFTFVLRCDVQYNMENKGTSSEMIK
jgi:hypothetical protein